MGAALQQDLIISQIFGAAVPISTGLIECNHYKIQICPSLFSLKEKECEDNSLEETLLPTSKAMYASVRGQRGRQQMGLQRGVQSRIQQQSRSNRSNSTSDEVAPTFDLVKLYSEPRRPIHARSEADLLIEKDTQQQMICQRTVSDWMLSSEIRLGSSLF